MPRGRRAAIAAAVAIGVGAVLAGCGGGRGTSSHALLLDPVAAAAAKTQHAGAARIRFSLAITTGQTGKALHMSGTGAIDGSSSEMSFRLGSMLRQMALPAKALKKFGHASMKAIGLSEDGDYVLYMHLGFLSSQIPGGKQWLKLDLSKFGKKAGLDLGSLGAGSQLQPSDLLGMLRGEGAKVHRVGPATIDGVSTTHYRVTIDLAKALATKGITSPLLKTTLAQMKTATDDVWIGRDGLVRRIQTSYSLRSLSGAPRMSMTMDLYDYGAHITIAAPPSDEVFDATQLAQSGLGSSLP